MENVNNCHDSACAAWREDSVLMPHGSDAFLGHFQNPSFVMEKMEKMANMANMNYPTVLGKSFYPFVMKRQTIARV